MADKLFTILVMVISSSIVTSMFIPEDTEILDDYMMDSSIDGVSDDSYLELRSLNGIAIRDKRNSPYLVRESPGLRSHFKSNNENSEITSSNAVISSPEYIRHTRSVDTENIEVEQKSERAEDSVSAEKLPVAEKQVMNRDGYLHDDRVATTDKWTKLPLESASKMHDSMDSAAAASMNEGIKSRTPLVNFVTQQRRNAEQIASIDQNPSEAKAEVYSDRFYIRPRSSIAPVSGRYQAYDDTYSRRYNGYDRDIMRSYQPTDYARAMDYMPRRSTYFDDYYYDYPISQGNIRYNMPDRRDHRQLLHTNEIYDLPPARPLRNHRIIYYATLPDIVRGSPRVDLKYQPQSNNRYDQQYYNSNKGFNQNVAPPYYQSSIAAPLAYSNVSPKVPSSKRS